MTLKLKKMTDSSSVKNVGLYIHIPWCVRKCPYCDFNSHEQKIGIEKSMQEQQYIDALLLDLDSEIHFLTQQNIPDFIIDSIFFGGGTPSIFSAESINAIMAGVRNKLSVSADAEVTLEANPGASDQARFAGYRKAGINRLSIGVQSLDDNKLKTLGRIHSHQQALSAYSDARDAGFTNINLDMMFALPSQTLLEAQQDLQGLIDLQPEHISYYQLTLEPNTLFHANPPTLPDEDLAADMQIQGQNLLAEAGYQQYEVSAYAQPNRQAQHNLHYWHFDDYLGIGAGAHGKWTNQGEAESTIIRRWKHKQPKQYMQSLSSKGTAVANTESISADKQLFEFMLNRLRLLSPVIWHELEQKIPLYDENLKNKLHSILEQLENQQLAYSLENGFALTNKGQSFLNTVLLNFLPEEQ